jgi:dolichyl-phosphate beta-glucosyltransferase
MSKSRRHTKRSRTTITRPDISIVIPAYCEAKRIGKTFDELSRFIKQDQLLQSKDIEIIVVAADAPDNTHELVLSWKGRLPNLQLLRPGARVGKGRDVQYGMLRAKGEVVIFMDADLATPLDYLPLFYRHHQAGHDIVIATRNLRRHHPNFWRRLLSNCGNLLFRIASGVWVEDSQCGFKLFSRQAAQDCFSRLTIMGWGFDMEVLAIAKVRGLKTKAHRVDDWMSVPDGTFAKDDFAASSISSLRDLGYIFWNRLRRTYSSGSSATG